MTKKQIIEGIRDYGYKANYKNIVWLQNKDNEIVGALMYVSNHSEVYFKIEKGQILKVKSYEDVKPLIFG